jgi:trk system potassium uptake protein TrkA
MGEAGKHIANVLVQEGHHLVVIDQSEQALGDAQESFDAMALRGHGASASVLRQANAYAADLVIAVTDNDEVNMLACLQAKYAGAQKTIARVSDPVYYTDDRGLVKDMLGSIDLVVNARMLVAMEMHKIVRSTSAVAVEDFAENRVEMVQLAVGNVSRKLLRPLKDLKLPDNTLIAAINRAGELIVPKGDDALEVGDDVLIVGRRERIPIIEKLFRRKRKDFVQRVFIMGGTDIGEHLARTLDADGIEVFFISRDRERCYALASSLGRHVTVLYGDGTDLHCLEEHGVATADHFVACSEYDEVNLMASLLAKDLGAARVIALVHKPGYSNVCARLGVDATLSPRLTVAQQVLKHVRHGQCVSARPVLDGRGEFLEFFADQTSRITGKKIMDVNFPRSANICAVVSNDRAYVPRGSDIIWPGDRVIIFTTPDNRPAIERMFQRAGLFG